MSITSPNLDDGNIDSQEQIEDNPLISDFNRHYHELAVQSSSIGRDSEITFQLSKLQSEGLGTLMSEYGSEELFNAIKKDLDKDNSNHTMLEVIQELEPDKRKRKALFQKIKDDAKGYAEVIEDDSRFDQIWGTKGNFIRKVELSSNEMQRIDTKNPFVGGSKMLSVMPNFATMVVQYEEELDKISKQLAEAENDIYKLVENRDKDKDESLKLLQGAIDDLLKAIDNEIKIVTDELEAKFAISKQQLETSKNALLTSLNDTPSLENALTPDFFEDLESQIMDNEKALREEIQEKTARLQELRTRTDGLYRAY